MLPVAASAKRNQWWCKHAGHIVWSCWEFAHGPDFLAGKLFDFCQRRYVITHAMSSDRFVRWTGWKLCRFLARLYFAVQWLLSEYKTNSHHARAWHRPYLWASCLEQQSGQPSIFPHHKCFDRMFCMHGELIHVYRNVIVLPVGCTKLLQELPAQCDAS